MNERPGYLNHTVLLLLVLLIAAFFRFYDLSRTPPGLNWDEAINGLDAMNALATGNYKIFYENFPAGFGREGLFINLVAAMISLFGADIWSIRAVSAIAGVLTVFGVYLLTRELFGGYRTIQAGRKEGYAACIWRVDRDGIKTALTTAFLLSVSFWHVNMSRQSLRAILLPLLLTFSFYMILKGFRTGSKLSYAAGGLFMGLAVHTYAPIRIVPFLLIALALLRLYELIRHQGLDGAVKTLEVRRYATGLIVFTVVTLVVSAPMLQYFLTHPDDFYGRMHDISIFNKADWPGKLLENILFGIGQFNFTGDLYWQNNYVPSPTLLRPVGFFFAIGILICLFNSFRYIFKRDTGNKQQRFPALEIFLILWFLLLLVPVVTSQAEYQTSLRTMGLLIPVFIFSGLGAFYLYAHTLEKLAPTATGKGFFYFALAVLIVIGAFQYKKYFYDWASHDMVKTLYVERQVKIGRFINELPTETNKLIVAPYSPRTVLFIAGAYNKNTRREKHIYNLRMNVKELQLDFEALRPYVLFPVKYPPYRRNEENEKVYTSVIEMVPGEFVQGDGFEYIRYD